MLFPNPYYPPSTTTADLYRWGILDDPYDDEDEYSSDDDYFDELAWEAHRDETL